MTELRRRRARSGGFTLVELLAATAVGTLVLAGLAGVVQQALQTESSVREHLAMVREADFALTRMVEALHGTPFLMLPLPDNPGTVQDESLRNVLALALDGVRDLDGDGFADADNDRDGRVDEDPGKDMNEDGAPGIIGIDDDADGSVDEGPHNDDDEDKDTPGGGENEEILNGVDDDGDGAVDEDLDDDLNQDGKPGILGQDDDGDGDIDEGEKRDDDEDKDDGGDLDEDWFDSVVYFQQGGAIIERLPNPHATSGTDYTESPIATGVTTFQVRRLPLLPVLRSETVEITLTLQGLSGTTVELKRTVRVGGLQ